MKKTNSKPVEYSCHAHEAQAVFVAGTFNDWRPQATPRSTVGPWQPSDEADPPSIRGGRGPPRRFSSHVVRDSSFTPHIDGKWKE